MSLELANSALWETVYEERYTAQFLDATHFLSMQEKPIPILLDKPLIAVLIKAHPDKPVTWKFGGILKQYISVNILSSSVITTAPIKRDKLYLDQLNILDYDSNLSENFAVGYEPPAWFFEAEIIIWKFLGNTQPMTPEAVRIQTIEASTQQIQLSLASQEMKLADLKMRLNALNNGQQNDFDLLL